MISPARIVTFDLLRRIELHGAYSDYLLNSNAVAQLERTDRNLATEIMYGTLRWQGLLDHFAAQACSRPWAQLDAEARILLRMSLYQMSRMDRVPDHAVVNDAVEIAKTRAPRGVSGFVNGVLRQLSRTRNWQSKKFWEACPAWVEVSLPSWLWERWAARYGEGEARRFALSLNEPPSATIRPHSTETGRNRLPEGWILSEVVPGAYLWNGEQREHAVPDDARAQDEASQLVPQLLGGIDGRRIWDCCAAPGGKSAILRERNRTGLVISSEIHARRASVLRRLLVLSTGGAEVIVADATAAPPFRVEFDAVLADVPCSGLGTLRKNPEIKWRFLPERLAALQRTQVSILSSAAVVVRRGGYLLYSTCSTEPEENEEVVRLFLDSHPGFRVVRPAHPPGIDAWLDPVGLMRTFPDTRKWDGLFAALMLRDS